MPRPDHLYKTTIVIWTEYDPEADEAGLEALGREATSGEGYCSKCETELVSHRVNFPRTEFFGVDDD